MLEVITVEINLQKSRDIEINSCVNIMDNS